MQSSTNNPNFEWIIDFEKWPHPVEHRNLLYAFMTTPEIPAAFKKVLEGEDTQKLRVTTNKQNYRVSVSPIGKPVTQIKIVGIPIERS